MKVTVKIVTIGLVSAAFLGIATAHAVMPVGTGTLVIVTNVTNNDSGVKTTSDFTDTVTGTNVLPTSTFVGSVTGTTVTLNAGSYSVAQLPTAGYNVTYSSGCSGTITASGTETCTISDDDKPLPAPACSMNGLYGVYNNLLTTTEGMDGPITGVTTGTTPFQYDWYAAKYFSFATTTPITSFNQPSNFFPVDDGLPWDPFYTAIHWTGYAIFPASGTYPINLGSDDDSWLYINGQLVDAVPENPSDHVCNVNVCSGGSGDCENRSLFRRTARVAVRPCFPDAGRGLLALRASCANARSRRSLDSEDRGCDVDA